MKISEIKKLVSAMCNSTNNENTVKEMCLSFVSDSINRYEKLKKQLSVDNFLDYMFSEVETPSHAKHSKIKRIIDEYKDHIERLHWIHLDIIENQ